MLFSAKKIKNFKIFPSNFTFFPKNKEMSLFPFDDISTRTARSFAGVNCLKIHLQLKNFAIQQKNMHMKK